MIVRFEPWGAWVKMERTAALVGLDRDGVRALTSRCAAGCGSCYLDARPEASAGAGAGGEA